MDNTNFTYSVRKLSLGLALAGLTFVSSHTAAQAQNAAAQALALSPAESVNTLVGSAEHGHTYPGATAPFGMVQLSPDTPQGGWDGVSGYHYSQNTIRGFSHTHFLGTGIGGLGDILVMPAVGNVDLNSRNGSSYASRFSHNTETATAGYYSVFLEKPSVKAELTATPRAGMHRYTFPQSDNSHIVVDLVSVIGGDLQDAQLKVENNTTLSGMRIVRDWGGPRRVYFVMQFSKPFDSVNIQAEGQPVAADNTDIHSRNIKALVNYKTTANEAIVVKVGISSTTLDGARKNLSTEIPGFNFDTVKAATVSTWNNTLGDIQIQTNDPKVRRTFYSNLYLSYLTPTLFNDVDKTYTGPDHQNHAANFDYYSTFSLWDTFRAQMPLLNLFQQKRSSDMVNTITNHFEEYQGISTPMWTLWGNEAWVMIGYHSAPVVAETYLKGIGNFDAEKAYQAIKNTALNSSNRRPDRGALAEYIAQGYINSTSSGQKQSVSRLLEYAYDDWCIAKMAEKLGHAEDAKLFYNRAANYRNVFDTTVGFMRGRKADGSWRRPFNPKQLVWADYTEANAWQYNWTVMQDVPGLINITGGDKAFVAKLDEMFNEKDDVMADIPDITGLIGQYAHGNEPVHHVAYLYNYAGVPSKTASRVREIMSKFYNDQPDGQPGNNDCGQMSAWFVFSALGFYPVNPSGGTYEIGSPLVNGATLRFANGKTFRVTAQNNSAQNMYIQSATLNGKNYGKSFLTYTDIMNGGELVLRMGAKPNLRWGQAKAARPVSGMPAGFKYAALPTPSTNGPVTLKLPIKLALGIDEAVGDFIPDPNMTEGSVNGQENLNIDVSTPGAAPARVYKYERYGKDLSYSYAVPAGTYKVTLHFAELFDEEAGMRIENISINGKEVLSNFDIFAAAGGVNKAVVRTFDGITPNAQGKIVVRVTAAPGSPDQNAKLSGLEITAQ